MAVHDDAGARTRFARALHDSLQLLAGTRVMHVEAGDGASLKSTMKISDPGVRRVFVIWHDADQLLRADRRAFSRAVSTCFALAAHAEHLSLDPLVVRRLICLGDGALADYFKDPTGQFRAWLDDGEEHDSPFWDVISIVPKPPVLLLPIAQP